MILLHVLFSSFESGFFPVLCWYHAGESIDDWLSLTGVAVIYNSCGAILWNIFTMINCSNAAGDMFAQAFCFAADYFVVLQVQ